MIQDMDALSRQLTELSKEDLTASRLIENFAHSEDRDEVRDEGSTAVTTITTDHALAIAGLPANQRLKITEVFKRLEKTGCGRFVSGRRGHPSRFIWEEKPATIARALKGSRNEFDEESPQTGGQPMAPSFTDAGIAEQAASRIITYKFPMRGDFLEVRLPFDLKRSEAERLARFVESLVAED